MGSCLGHSHSFKDSFNFNKFYFKKKKNVRINKLSKSESEEHIINDFSSFCGKYESETNIARGSNNCFCFGRLKSVFSNTNNEYENPALKLELLDDEWSISEEEGGCSKRYEEGLIPSSAKTKESMGCTSVSMNSLDLEWEHLPEMVVFSSNVDKEEPKSATSAEACSRISDSGDSLEWDLVEIEMKEDVDTETEQLLHEIEILSSKTLQETQDWAAS